MRLSRLFAALGVVLGLAVVAQIVNANVLSDLGDAEKYGSVGVPGAAVLRLPAGSVEVMTHQVGTDSTEPPPGLELSVRPVGGDGPALVITKDRGSQFGSSGTRDTGSLSYRRILRVDVPRAGAYRVSAASTTRDGGYRLGFGRSPPLSAWTIWEIALVAMVVVALGWLGVRLWRHRA